MKNRTTTVTTGPKKNRATTETTYETSNLPRLANKLTKVPKSMKGVVQEGMQEGVQQMQRTTGNTTPPPLIQALMQKVESDRLNAIPFKNSSINVFDKKRYDISREFDGQEVPGSLTVRPTLFGGTVETERFDMPGGGTNMSRTRKNAEGQPMRRIVKDKNINK